MYIDEPGITCAAATPVFDFTWPATEQRICFFDKPYRQVKNLPKSASVYYASTDSLAGTFAMGVEGNQHTEYHVVFSEMTYQRFLFKSGNDLNFILADKSIKDVSGALQMFEVIQSSESQQPSSIQM